MLSYLVQVYSALRERNALALAVDLMTDGTGDAAVTLIDTALDRRRYGGLATCASVDLGSSELKSANDPSARFHYAACASFSVFRRLSGKRTHRD
ncbi:hypothetical protein J2Y58_000905 [Sphingomonas sp. BE138]|uniref:hypothetical protein n=1 Tax=Sphingomonas sp. BE138 TaxID=2817845 RepID=UPI00285542CD|nr:hypothetical protein [Sphingomonas sp. BE138]MDR6787564.1 hypothetical protein [Sphingomonas sp. BE138]